MHSLVALLVFAIGLGATFYYWRNLQQGVQNEMSNAFAKQTQQIVDATQARLGIYENFLRGSAGLVSVHTGLTQDDWTAYQASYSIAKSYPDIEGTGVARYVTKDQLPAFIDDRRSQGETNYQVLPAGDRDMYVPIAFNTRYNDSTKSNRGYDTYTEPTRHAAMDRAVEMNRMTMTGRVSLLSDSSKNHSAFVLYYPVYRKDQPTSTAADRRNSLYGFVSMGVDTAKFSNTILNANQNPHVGLKIYDAETSDDTRLAFQSDNFSRLAGRSGSRVESQKVYLNGHTWQFEFAAAPELVAARERQLPEQALWRGLVTCIFFAGLVWYLITDRERKYARQKREEVQTAKDDLLSLASHQLRTPATVVKQYVGMLLQGYAGKLSDQQLSMLDNAYSSNERQLDIINQLLYVARLDAGRITLHCKRVDLSKMLRDVAREQAEAITNRQQTLAVELPTHTITAVADPHYIRMVLENLLSNAIKYTPEKGHVTLELKTAPHEVILVVSDDGVGISSEVQATIFEKFTRVENELSNDVNGSGVGLYLTKQIVELHGGTIEVQSEPDKGSSFIIRIPSHPEEEGTDSV